MCQDTGHPFVGEDEQGNRIENFNLGTCVWSGEDEDGNSVELNPNTKHSANNKRDWLPLVIIALAAALVGALVAGCFCKKKSSTEQAETDPYGSKTLRINGSEAFDSQTDFNENLQGVSPDNSEADDNQSDITTRLEDLDANESEDIGQMNDNLAAAMDLIGKEEFLDSDEEVADEVKRATFDSKAEDF